MAWALVERGVVRELRGADPAGHYHPEVPWIADAPDAAVPGWTYADGKWAAPVIPVVVPAEVNAYQLRAALLAQPGRQPGESLLADWSAAVTASADKSLAIAWEYATSWTRQGNLVLSVAQALGLTKDQVDALFIAAAKLRA